MPQNTPQINTVDLNTLNKLPIAIALLDNEKFYFLNTIAIKLFKIPKKHTSNLEQFNVYNFIKESYHKEIKKSISKISKGEILPSRELECKDFNNQPFFIEVISNVVTFNNKKIIQSTFSQINNRIKEKKEATETKNLLEQTKQKFDLITQNGNDVISFYTYYPTEKYLYVSPNILNALGYKPSELLNDNNFFTKRIKEYSVEFKKIDAILKNNQRKNIPNSQSYVFKTIKKNNEVVWIENSISPILDNKGKISFYLNVYRDITKQKEKEIELELQKNNYLQLLNNMPLAYLIMNKGVCVYCNNDLLKLLKLKNTKQIIGKFGADFIVKHQRKRIIERIQELYLQKNMNLPHNYIAVDSDNNQIEVEIISTLIKYNNETCILALINNVSEKKAQDYQKIKIELTEQNNKILQAEIQQREKIQQTLTEKTAHLTSILDNSTHLIWTINKKNQITSFNKNFYNLIIKKHNIKIKVGDIIDESIIDPIYNKTYTNFWYPKYKQAFKGNKIEFERQDFNEKNNVVYRKVYINPIFDKQKKVIEISCIAHDITDTKIYEQKLINQSAKLNAVFESGSQLIWTVNDQFILTSYNQNYFKLIQKNIQNKKIIYLKDTIENKNLWSFWTEKFKQVFNNKPQTFLHKSIIDNQEIYREIFLQPIFSNNKIAEVSAIAYDITERVTNEKKLITQAAKINSIFDSSHHYIWTIDTQQKLTSFNKNYFDLIANLYNTQPYVGLSLNRGVLSNDKEYSELLKHNYQKAFLGSVTNFEIEVLDKNGNKVYLEVFLNPILNNKEVVEVSGIAHDVTDKKISQQKIEQSLKEKEVLLKEVHHRVKNNMQVISSILNLQSSYVNDTYALTLLKESQNRIKTMAYIHESLYQNKSFTSVNFSEYIETLTKNIIQSYAISDNKIKLILNLQKTVLNLDTSIPAGLIVNELITNAIKHAFPDKKTGTITINLTTQNNIVFLEVKDNGTGFADSIDFKNSPSLGLQLVNTLIDQIDGQLNFESNHNAGTKIIITFKM